MALADGLMAMAPRFMALGHRRIMALERRRLLAVGLTATGATVRLRDS